MKSLLAKRRMKMLLSIIFIAAMLFLVTSAWSQSTRYCVRNYLDHNLGFGIMWYNGWVWHAKDVVVWGTMDGDIKADVDATVSIEINYNTNKGHVYGEQTLYDAVIFVEGVKMEGGFEGIYNFGFISLGEGHPSWEGQYNANGSGDFEGMKLFQTVIGEYEHEEYVGFILDPKGFLPDMPCE